MRSGGFSKFWTPFAFISTTVGGAEIPDGSQVLTWTTIADSENPGTIEGFTCDMTYSTQDSNPGKSVNVRTYSEEPDFTEFSGSYTDWCDITGNQNSW